MALIAVAAAVNPVDAQYNSPQGVRFVSATPYGTFSKFGVRVGPYRLQLLGELGQPTVDAFCVDFNNYVYTASSGWQANIVNLTGDLAGTRQGLLFGQTVALRNYEASAWLAAKMMADPNRSGNWWKYHGAIWYLTGGGDPFNPDAGLAGNFVSPFGALTATEKEAVRGYAVQALNAAYADQIDPSQWAVITPVPGASSQEFITSVVPEPASLILLGSGLLALGLLAYVRHAA